MPHSPFIDLRVLAVVANTGMRTAFTELCDGCESDDVIYGFGFFSHEGHYLTATGFTENGLTETVDHYIASAEGNDRSYLKQRSPEAWRRMLRWSPADSPFHDVGSNALRQADSMLSASEAAYHHERSEQPDDWDPDFDKSADLRDAIYDTLVDVLRSLDAEGVFGSGRDQIVLNIWEGDQSYEDRIDFARRCNPAEIAERFGREELGSYD